MTSLVALAAALCNAALLAVLYRNTIRMRDAYRSHVSVLKEEVSAKDALAEAHRVRAESYRDLCAEQASVIAFLSQAGGASRFFEGERPPSVH